MQQSTVVSTGSASSPFIATPEAIPRRAFTLSQVPALDGLRGISIAAVILVHLGLLPGGFLGVDVFFTLSGFLITALLLQEFEKDGTIAIGQFYLRRLRRLFPAFCSVVIVTLILKLATWRQAVPVFLYYGNWIQTQATPSSSPLPLGLLSHTWSLSIEEQFYLLWPIALLGMLRARLNSKRIAQLLVISVLVIASWRFLLWRSGVSFYRLYFGSDTHADGLLVGCLIAIALNRGILKLPAASKTRVAGITSLAAFLILLVSAPFSSDWRFVFSLSVTPLIALGLILWGLNGSYLLSRPSAVALGKLSYSLYLWHYLIFSLIVESGLMGTGKLSVLATALAMIVSTLSYHLIEQPFLKK